ncbi:MAG: WxcM-like domain-containing protein [Nitrosarchaeum sp.]|nr:WxcM-like domain-containing protein [Nitrosarchaeum sp.]
MDYDDIGMIKLEKHPTKDIHDQHVNGSLTVIWRDWDSIMKNPPKMVYVTSVNPGEIKGPHIHTQRNSYFVCIHGKVLFVAISKDGKYKEIESSEENPAIIYVPKNLPSAHMNLSDETSRILTIADLAWRPNDNEMKNTSFENYDWSKWRKN